MMKNRYQCLNNQEYSTEYFSLVPIRSIDRYKIMQWRNEQMFHLRQSKALTSDDQDLYFENIISKLFDKEKPNQILFSLIKENECIGYGGLVHIDWEKKRAEISFLLNPELEKDHFNKLWLSYLFVIEKVAFQQLDLNEIFTYSYEVRPKLYPILEQAGFIEKERILNAIQIQNKPIDALVHIKRKSDLTHRLVQQSDAQLLFDWANDSSTRKSSLNPNKIIWEEHLMWFNQKINDPKTKMYLFLKEKKPVSILRLENNNVSINISFSVDKNYRGKGIGGYMIAFALRKYPEKQFSASVIENNKHSNNIFLKNKFEIDYVSGSANHKIIHYTKLPYGND